MVIKGVIFDVDGVLVDSEPYYFEQRLAFLNSIGARLTAEKSRQQIGSNMNAVLKQLFPQHTDAERNVIKNGYTAYKAAHPLSFKRILNPDAQPLLAKLTPQYQIGLASAGERSIIQQMLLETDLQAYFTTIISGAEIAHNKPAPDVYIEALQKMRLTSAEAVAIEDSALGIQAAKAAGLTVIALKPLDKQFTIDQSAADYQIESLKEVPAILTTLA
ncbi:HAD family hydrolase [Latilactobacillus graminis]|uniref:HAD-superhydrolase, subIA, variant 3 family protein n=2 Tax=Latilactobacillus graminis TaxID=60519 RepID=A0AA89I129_9LACO|nr:HAD family phosphatase [Latilactobacillus graminis]KRM22301.1 HAD-superhydrolase, subIA, variant 3 family protein [Latilactobacillus graminis DSM 20719]QFP79524.1 HAD family phosphatase [Latilactobacillus graminis]